ncbi:MAG: hypothetical protein OEY99_00885 [Aigarchaeota archaeon]|nr:hypothetical protein [Aigarchaeota archaeon]
MLELQTFPWTRSHFTLSVDPCRVAMIPSTLDARTGLVALLMESRRDLEARDPYSIVEAANAVRFLPSRFTVTPRVRTQ